MASQKNSFKRQESVKEEQELHEMSDYTNGEDVKQGDTVSPPHFIINDDDMLLLTDVTESADLSALPKYDEIVKRKPFHNSPRKYNDEFSDSLALCVDSDKADILETSLSKKHKNVSPQNSVNLKKLQETMQTKDSRDSIGKFSLNSSLSRQGSKRSEKSAKFSSTSRPTSRQSSWDTSGDTSTPVESLKRNSFDNESYSIDLEASLEISSVVSTPRQQSFEDSVRFSPRPRTPKTFRPTASPVPHPYRVRAPPRSARTLEERFRDEMRNCIVEQTEQMNERDNLKKDSNLLDPKVVLVIATIAGGVFIILGGVLLGLSHQPTLKFHGGAEPGKALLVIGFLLVGAVAIVLFMLHKKNNSNREVSQINVQEVESNAQTPQR